MFHRFHEHARRAKLAARALHGACDPKLSKFPHQRGRAPVAPRTERMRLLSRIWQAAIWNTPVVLSQFIYLDYGKSFSAGINHFLSKCEIRDQREAADLRERDCSAFQHQFPPVLHRIEFSESLAYNYACRKRQGSKTLFAAPRIPAGPSTSSRLCTLR